MTATTKQIDVGTLGSDRVYIDRSSHEWSCGTADITVHGSSRADAIRNWCEQHPDTDPYLYDLGDARRDDDADPDSTF